MANEDNVSNEAVVEVGYEQPEATDGKEEQNENDLSDAIGVESDDSDESGNDLGASSGDNENNNEVNNDDSSDNVTSTEATVTIPS